MNQAMLLEEISMVGKLDAIVGRLIPLDGGTKVRRLISQNSIHSSDLIATISSLPGSATLLPLKKKVELEELRLLAHEAEYGPGAQETLGAYADRVDLRELTVSLPVDVVQHWSEHPEAKASWCESELTKDVFMLYVWTVDNSLKILGDYQCLMRLASVIPERIEGLQQNITAYERAVERRNRRWKLLEERPSSEGGDVAEILAHESVVGIVIGKQGENLSRVARTHKVEVRVYPDENGIRRIRLYGNSAEQVQNARKELNYVYWGVSLPPDLAPKVYALIGDGKGSYKELSQIPGIHSVWARDAKNELFVCGLDHSIRQFLSTLSVLLSAPLERKLSSPEVNSNNIRRHPPKSARRKVGNKSHWGQVTAGTSLPPA